MDKVLKLDDDAFAKVFGGFKGKVGYNSDYEGPPAGSTSSVQEERWSLAVKPLFDTVRADVIHSIAQDIIDTKDFTVPFPKFIAAQRVRIGDAYREVFSTDKMTVTDDQYAQIRTTTAFQDLLTEAQDELLRLLSVHRTRCFAEGEFDVIIDAAHASIKLIVQKHQMRKYGVALPSTELVYQYNAIFDELMTAFLTDLSVYNIGDFGMQYLATIEIFLAK